MAVTLLRLFMIDINFRNIIFSFWRGVRPLQVYSILLLIVGYFFAVSAFFLFKGKLTDKTINFNSLWMTIITMFQIFIGPGWHQVMQHAVAETNKALVWFFVVYVLI